MKVDRRKGQCTTFSIKPCRICETPFEAMKNAAYCIPCRVGLYQFRGYVSERVKAAIERGRLADPKTLKCADCPKMAIEYDHRDYGRPLEVEPVCRSCNNHRGPAVGFGTFGIKCRARAAQTTTQQSVG